MVSDDARLFVANEPQMTETGSTFAKSGESKMFQVKMALLSGASEENKKYAETANINNWKIGSTTADAQPIGNYDLQIDKIYKVTVTGSVNNITVSFPVYLTDMEF